ncbi:hypothetical protein [Carboxylicivirga linearis]|uniref:Uncharacterized protein n=1 Tax=Carboxylicivirga linearis TaxID=1628157 RepID=A0ABS5JYE3_9BACT|nr:hypothetical protein [Carboxylicivirga linearis]MBS2099940.1 hypothetical protein [Carboxylicivirga linearis]
MEFIFQVLAQLFSPVDEDQAKEKVLEMKEVEKQDEKVLEKEKVEQEQPNLFGLMEFH